MKVDLVAFNINEIMENLSSIEEVIGIVFGIFRSHWLANHDINAIVPIELHNLSSINATLLIIHKIFDIENSINARIFQLLDIHFKKWIRSHKEISLGDSLEEEATKEIAVGLIKPPIANEALDGLFVEARRISTKLPFILMWVVDNNLPLWIPLLDDSVSCLSDKSILEIFLTFILELSNIGCFFLHHLHGNLYRVHRLAKLYAHPFERHMRLVHLHGRGPIVFKDPLVRRILVGTPDREAHLVLLPDIVVMDNLYADLPR